MHIVDLNLKNVSKKESICTWQFREDTITIRIDYYIVIGLMLRMNDLYMVMFLKRSHIDHS